MESKAVSFGLRDVLAPLLTVGLLFLGLFVKDAVAPVKQDAAITAAQLNRIEADLRDIRNNYATKEYVGAKFDEVNRRLSRLEDARAIVVP